MDTFTLTSQAFADGDSIPIDYSCEGDDINPPLEISGMPEGTMSLALIMEDPDIPEAVKENMGIEVYDHWVAYNIPPSTTEIEPGDAVGTQGVNSGGGTGYTGPCPPAEHKPTEHRYIFTVYALNGTLDLSEGANKQELKAAMQDNIIETAQLVGRYQMQTVS